MHSLIIDSGYSDPVRAATSLTDYIAAGCRSNPNRAIMQVSEYVEVHFKRLNPTQCLATVRSSLIKKTMGCAIVDDHIDI